MDRFSLKDNFNVYCVTYLTNLPVFANHVKIMGVYFADNTSRFGCKKRASWQRLCGKSWRLWIG